MAFIDVVNWDPKSNAFFAYKYPNTNLSTAAQLLVRESQEAVLFSKGKLMGKFGPGKYTLNTENLPILRNLFGLPFGGKNPFTAEVWFVNKTAPLNIDWKATGMNYFDPAFNNAMIPVLAEGRYGLKVKDAEKFLIELAGALTSYTATDLTDHFKGKLVSRTNSVIMTYMKTNRLSIAEISAFQEDLSNFLHQSMKEFWDDYGFDLTGFYITQIGVDASNEIGRKAAQALAEKTAAGITGHTWQEEQMFKTAQTSPFGIFGVNWLSDRVMSRPGNGVMPGINPAGNVYGVSDPNVGQKSSYMRKEWFCARCGTKHPVTSQFCDNCGHRYNPCPQCGTDTPDNASRCVKCGRDLDAGAAAVGSLCWNCGQPVQPGKKYCPNCGSEQ